MRTALKREKEVVEEEEPAFEPFDDPENPTFATFEELQTIIKGYQDLSGLSFEKAENERLRYANLQNRRLVIGRFNETITVKLKPSPFLLQILLEGIEPRESRGTMLLFAVHDGRRLVPRGTMRTSDSRGRAWHPD